MSHPTTRPRRRSLATILVATLTTLTMACAERAPVAPTLAAPARDVVVPPELGACSDIAVPAGHVPSFHTYATGVQVYKWTGSAWTFDAPVAELYADAMGKALVGTHYRGPTWESTSGSTVVGQVEQRCTVAGTIQWLRLRGASSTGPGVFRGTTFIQRVNTTGGTAPTEPGTTVGEERRVPYTAEYWFYKAG